MSKSDPPNVVWIVLEDTSPRFGCYGDPVADTPTIDGLAAAGRRFPNAFCAAPVCSPSRAALHTGCYPTAIGAQHHRTSQPTGSRPGYESTPPPYVRFLSEYLRSAGYVTVMAGSTDFCHATPISAFDICSSANSWDDGRPDWMVEDAHWRDAPEDRPFFAVFNPTMTHESGMFGDPDEPPATDPDAVSVPPYFPDTPRVRNTIARHYDNLARADERVAELLAELDAAGLAEDTVIMLFSDHGEGMPRGKRWLYDSGTAVPMIVRWPGHIEAGTVDRRLVSLVDVAPTVLRLAGHAVPQHMDGQPFLPGDTPTRSYVFAARDRHDEFHDTSRAVRTRRFKYVRNYYAGRPYVLWNDYRNRHPIMAELLAGRASGTLEGPAAAWAAGQRPPEELYDLAADPHEVENLASDAGFADVLDRLRTALDSWIEQTGDRGLEAEEAMLAHQWPGGEQPRTDPPAIISNSSADRATEPVADRVTIPSPADVQLYCPTAGAQIVYRIVDEHDRWQLFDGPISLGPGTHAIRTRAIRYGYTESEEQSATIEVVD